MSGPEDVTEHVTEDAAAADPGANVVLVGGVSVHRGSRVRLRPSRRADAHDLFFAGMSATVAGVHIDFENAVHLAVTLDDDPARDLHNWYGRYLYFSAEEVEPMSDTEPPITTEEEPQEARGAPGSRDRGSDLGEGAGGPTGDREAAEEPKDPGEATGINPQEPIDPDMPYLQPGDQGG